MAQRWEYAELYYYGQGGGQARYVRFSNRPEWSKIDGGNSGLVSVLGRLGELGFELVSSDEGRYILKRVRDQPALSPG